MGHTRVTVYHARPTLRWLIYLGTIGLAGLTPGRERLPIWLVIGALCLPIALCELGAELFTSSTATRWRELGVRCQLVAATLFPTLLIAGASLRAPNLRGKPFLIALGSLGALASAIIWWDYGRTREGRELIAVDPLAAGERAASRAGLVDALAVIGGAPFLVGAISAAFVTLALVAAARHGGAVPSRLWLALGFFAACLLVAVMQGTQRWEAYVPGSRITHWRQATQTAAFLLFGGALLAIALSARRDGTVGALKAAFMAVGGAGCLLAGVATTWRAVRPSGRRLGYQLVREGLLEMTRRGAFLFPWPAIEAVAIGEYAHQVTLFVRLSRHDLVQGPWRSGLMVPDGAVRRPFAKRRRSLQWCRRLFDADIMIMASLIDRPLGDLFRDISSLLENEAARGSSPLGRRDPAAVIVLAAPKFGGVVADCRRQIADARRTPDREAIWKSPKSRQIVESVFSVGLSAWKFPNGTNGACSGVGSNGSQIGPK